MCELFSMNSKFPTDVNFSLEEFSLHGGGTGPHSDGWGIAYAMGRDFRIIKEPEAAFESDCVQYIEKHRFASHLVLSHIRRASPSKKVAFENTHPFDREFLGRRLVFAHNGFVEEPESLFGDSDQRWLPLGGTDSEITFMFILSRLAQRITRPEEYHPRLVEEVLREVSPMIRERGKFNFLLADTQFLFAHGDTSLYSLCRACDLEEHQLASEALRVLVSHGPGQDVALVATNPLTLSEPWVPFEPGEIRVFHEGRRI